MPEYSLSERVIVFLLATNAIRQPCDLSIAA